MAGPRATISSTKSRMQELLNQSGGSIVVDGEYGTQTKTAVDKFKRSRKLAEDGVVNTVVWDALFSASGTPPLSQPSPGKVGVQQPFPTRVSVQVVGLAVSD
jgi:peptidoglycan hydrolase-like protein with peptidoglycan-binding domain